MSKEITIAPEQSDQALMARQLSEQYQRAVGGLWEVVKFGAMMMHLRAALVGVAGPGNSGSGRYASGSGIEAWIKTNCPEISRPTAYRFLAIAEGLREEVKLGVKVDLLHLLTADHADLEPKLLKKRADIQDLLEGRSQRQLLLMFAEPKIGGNGGANLLNQWLQQHYPDLVGKSIGHLPQPVQKAWNEYCEARRQERYGDKTKAEYNAQRWWDEILAELNMERATDKRYQALPIATLKRISTTLLDLKRIIDDTIAKG